MGAINQHWAIGDVATVFGPIGCTLGYRQSALEMEFTWAAIVI
jgi:hypothetical protein